VRVPDSAAAGIATVKLSFEGWPDGDVQPSVFKVPVVPRKATYSVSTSPRQHAVWRLPEGWQVSQVSVAPNGRDVAVASMRRDKSGDTYRLNLCEFPTGRVRYTLLDLPPEEAFRHWMQMVFSLDGRWLAVSVLRQGDIERNARRDYVYIYADRFFLIDLTNGTIAHRMQTDGFTVTDLAFNPNGTKLATAQFSRIDHLRSERLESDFNGDVRIWEVASGKQLATFGATQGNGPFHVAFAPDGKSVAVSYSVASPDRTRDTNFVRIFDPVDGRLRVTLPERDQPQFIPGSSRSLLVRGTAGNLILHDLENRRDNIVLTFPPKEPSINYFQA
jgi:dipeptidyl aminopeptidase/acylaminoacyl peptidase